MDNEVIYRNMAQTETAIARLGEMGKALSDPLEDATCEAILRQFTLAYEFQWKLYNKIHVLRGRPKHSVRTAYECIAEAGAAGWLKNRALWEAMIIDYGIAAGEHDTSAAQAIATNIAQRYQPEMQRALTYLKAHYIHASPFDRWRDRMES